MSRLSLNSGRALLIWAATLLVLPSGSARAAPCPADAQAALKSYHEQASKEDPLLKKLYAQQTEIVGRINRLAQSDSYKLEGYLALQKEHEAVRAAMDRRRAENTVTSLKTLSPAHQRLVLRSLYGAGGC